MMSVDTLQYVLYVVLIIALTGIIGLVIQAFLMMKQFRRVMDRLELITDIKGWLGFFRKMPKYFSKSESR
jgi:hypothetical protein